MAIRVRPTLATSSHRRGSPINAFGDLDFDAQGAGTAGRPLASGQISVRGAWIFVTLCALAGLAILASLNILSFYLGLASLGLVAAYPFMKRITGWPQAWLGLTFNGGALMGYAAARGGPSLAVVVVLAAWARSAGTEFSVAVSPLPWPPVLLYGA